MRETLGTPGCGSGGSPLADLDLSAAEYQALTGQGFVAAERRQRNGRSCGPYYKLRSHSTADRRFAIWVVTKRTPTECGRR